MENEILEKNLEDLLQNALSPMPQEGKKAALYQRLVKLQQEKQQPSEFPALALVPSAGLLILLSIFLIMLFLSSGLNSILLPGYWLAFLLPAANLLMIPAAGYIIVKRRQNA